MTNDDDIITLETFYDPMRAHIVRARLQESGINCFLADEHTITLNPFYNNALGGIKLKVFARDVAKCHTILAEDVALESQQITNGVAEDITICPHCGSANVRYGIATTNRYGWMGVVLSIFFSIVTAITPYPLTNRKVWHCFECGDDF